MRWTSAAACGAIAATLAQSAGAGERETRVGVDLGGSALVIGGKGSDLGSAVGAHWAYGLTDQFDVMVEGSWSVDTFGGHAGSVANADAGVSYILDVVRWVPYFGLLVGGYEFVGSEIGGPKLLPGAALALGLDYRVNREIAVGLAVREHMFLTEPSAYPSFVQALARVEYTWGW